MSTPLPSLSVGARALVSPLAFAPMSGVSNGPARWIAREAGAGLVFTETISARALVEGRETALRKLDRAADEAPLAAQLFGRDPDAMAEACRILADRGLDWVDLNLGCPVKKFERAGAGASLLRELPLVGRIVGSMRAAFPGTLSVKTRLGWDAHSVVAAEVARIAAEQGAELLSVHGRTRAQQYRGRADRDAIAEVVAAVPGLPVLANGDIRTPDDVFAMLGETGAAGVMIGRAAIGNPWIFAHTLERARGEAVRPPSAGERLVVLERHVAWLASAVDDPTARLHQVKRHAAAYSKGLAGGARFRERAIEAADPDQIVRLARAFLGERRAA